MVNRFIDRMAARGRSVLRTLVGQIGLKRLSELGDNKYAAELRFQTGWAQEFPAAREQVLDYWRKYRYLDDIRARCGITEQSTILDVGCGISTVLHYLDGKRFGIDPLAEQYCGMYAYPEAICVKKGHAEAIPFPDGYFDVAMCSNVLDHVTDPGRSIQEIYRVLKPGGYFVLTVEVFGSKQLRDPAHPHCLTKQDVHALLAPAFMPEFERESDWIGLRAYARGATAGRNSELIVICCR